MPASIDLGEKVEAEMIGTEPHYDSWKRAKIERGLAQSHDRAAMIPAEQVLRDLSLAG